MVMFESSGESYKNIGVLERLVPDDEDGPAKRYLGIQEASTRRSVMDFCLAVLRQRQTITQGTWGCSIWLVHGL